MRLGLKAKEIFAITLLTSFAVATATLVHLSQLTRVVVQEAAQQGDLVAKQIYAQSRRSLSRVRRGDPGDVLRSDRELRALLEASVGYSPHLLYALVTDRDGRAILHSEPDKENTIAPERPSLGQLLALDPVRRFHAVYGRGNTLETTLPVSLDGVPFGAIRLGISTSLLRRELNASLRQSVVLAGLALVGSWLVAIGLANLLLKPIRTLTREMGRLRRGEFDIDAHVGGGDEVGELASELQRLGQQLESDRLKMLGEKTRLRQVVDSLEDGIIFFDRDRRFLFFNKAAEGLLGRALEEAVGCELDAVLEPSHPCRALLERALEQEAGVRDAAVTVPTGGRSREFLVSVFSLTDAGKAMGTMVLVKDLEAIKTFQSLITYSARLTALGRLTSGVAHEVKNPLNAMVIHLELLKEKLEGASEDVRRHLEIIGNEIRRLDRVVQEFLRFMRPPELNLKPVDLNALLRDVAALLEAEWQPAGIRFAFGLEPTLPLVTGDEELLRQALVNLIVNACQAMPGGGTVGITTEQSEEFVTVSVTDEGVGIAPDDLDKVFKLYYTTKPDGTGIGLSAVYRVTQLHGGATDVTSEVGRGTTVTVRLPVR